MKTESKIIQVKQVYSEKEFNNTSDPQKYFSIYLELIDKLEDMNVIIYNHEPDLFGNIEFIATIEVMVPIEQICE